MLNYLPLFMQNYPEMQSIMQSENEEFLQAKALHQRLIANRYVSTADTDGIARFEKFLNITPLDSDTLEERRFRCLSKWNRDIPYNYQKMLDRLNQLCGADGYALELNYTSQTLTARVVLQAKNSFAEIKTLLREMCPANLLIDVELMYNTHDQLSAYTHSQLAIYQHEQLRNEVL